MKYLNTFYHAIIFLGCESNDMAFLLGHVPLILKKNHIVFYPKDIMLLYLPLTGKLGLRPCFLWKLESIGIAYMLRNLPLGIHKAQFNLNVADFC